MTDTEIKINILPMLIGITIPLVSGLLIWFLKDVITSIRKNTHAIIELTAKFEVFKERTDDIPDLKKNLNEAHKRIDELKRKEISQ